METVIKTATSGFEGVKEAIMAHVCTQEKRRKFFAFTGRETRKQIQQRQKAQVDVNGAPLIKRKLKLKTNGEPRGGKKIGQMFPKLFKGKTFRIKTSADEASLFFRKTSYVAYIHHYGKKLSASEWTKMINNNPKERLKGMATERQIKALIFYKRKKDEKISWGEAAAMTANDIQKLLERYYPARNETARPVEFPARQIVGLQPEFIVASAKEILFKK